MIETKFKQTEIGLIPEDWEVRQLKSFATLINGRAYRQEELLSSGKYRVLRVGNFFSNDAWYYSNLELDEKLYCNQGDLLYAWSCTYGAYIWSSYRTIYHYHIWKVICDGVNKAFLYYLLNNDVDKQKRSSQGSTMSHITKSYMEERLFSLPSSTIEQERIAEALSNMDKLISSLSKTIEKKRMIKRGAMQQLLTGKKRLPGFDGEWVESELGTIVNIQRGSMLKSSEYQFGSIPVIAGGITPAGFHNVANRNGRTITISASGANAGYISYYKEPIFATDCSTISEGNDYFIDFIYYVLLLKQNDIFRLQTGGAQPHIHPKDIAPLKINIPCLYEEQVAIANILSTMDNEIESLEEERDKYIQLKEGMMQKLLTGQIRLVEAETKQQDLPKAKAANVYFRRSVLAAEIADRLCEERTFGHVKMEKLIFLTEHLCHIDIDSHYHRDAAGPYDNRALRSIDSQMKKQKWFEANKEDKGYRYMPMQNRGGHKKYFEKYYADVMPMFDKIIDTFRSSTTEQCEIIATLYSAWNDLLQSHKSFTDDDILNEVLNNWHESKKRISRNRWQTELDWMRANGFMPQTENN